MIRIGASLGLTFRYDGRDGSLQVEQDVSLYSSLLEPGSRLSHPLASGRRAWLQVVSGRLHVGGEAVEAGDGLAATSEPSLEITADAASELLLFDLA